MAELTHAECEQHATELMGLEPDARVRRILAICDRALAENLPGLPIIVGNILRDWHHYEWADYLFQIARRIPSIRPMVQFEEAVSLSMQNRPAEAVSLLAEHDAAEPLSAYGQRVYALQLGRLGRMAEASARLERAVELEPGSLEECVALRQLFDYMQRFPEAEAVARCLALREAHPLRGPRELVDEMISAVREHRPYALMRLNDGEGSIIHLSIDDEAQFGALHTRNRKAFHRVWFGDEAKVFDADFLEAVREFNGAIADADCVAAYLLEHMKAFYRKADVLGVPCVFQIIRKLEALLQARPERAGRVTMTDPVIHFFLLYDGALERLVRSQRRVGLVSCHSGLPAALRAGFGVEEVLFHQTPGEAIITGGAEPEPFAVWHGRLKAELAAAEPGVLYLVSAGVMGKVYCSLIKQAGGVALDIGSVADIWMRVPTRIFDPAAPNFALVA